MTLPYQLPEPREIIQTAHTCWAAAYESWANAAAARAGVSNEHTAPDLIRQFRRRGLTRDGRLTEAGFHELEAVGHMRLREARLQHWTVDNIATLLSGVGYLYVVVIGERNAQGNRMSHVVVIYGATSERILVMDPLPGRGLVEFPAGNFVNVGAGVSIIDGTYVNPS